MVDICGMIRFTFEQKKYNAHLVQYMGRLQQQWNSFSSKIAIFFLVSVSLVAR